MDGAAQRIVGVCWGLLYYSFNYLLISLSGYNLDGQRVIGRFLVKIWVSIPMSLLLLFNTPSMKLPLKASFKLLRISRSSITPEIKFVVAHIEGAGFPFVCRRR